LEDVFTSLLVIDVHASKIMCFANSTYGRFWTDDDTNNKTLLQF